MIGCACPPPFTTFKGCLKQNNNLCFVTGLSLVATPSANWAQHSTTANRTNAWAKVRNYDSTRVHVGTKRWNAESLWKIWKYNSKRKWGGQRSAQKLYGWVQAGYLVALSFLVKLNWVLSGYLMALAASAPAYCPCHSFIYAPTSAAIWGKALHLHSDCSRQKRPASRSLCLKATRHPFTSHITFYAM